MRLEQVPADDAAVGAAEHGMDMQGGAALADRDVAEQRHHLDLLVDGDVRILLVCQSK
jgi:hypothetical protein